MDIKGHIQLLLKASHGDPFSVLGMHIHDGRIQVRAFIPDAREVWVVRPAGPKAKKNAGRKSAVEIETVYPMTKLHPEGFFIADLEGETTPFGYRLRKLTHGGGTREFYDPYSFGPVLTDFDIHLFSEGTHYKNYEKLGSHVMTIGGVQGVHFAVWAPNAQRVGVVGDFNRWDGRRHPMRLMGSSGIWEIFIPGLGEGQLYKFEVKSKYNNYQELKADPFAFFFEMRPKTSAVVYNIDNKHEWLDQAWMDKRAKRNWFESPVSIYEVHPGSWMRVPEEDNRFLTYREFADRLVPYIVEMGFTHIEFMPVSEHPFDASWGYQTIGYYAPTSRFGPPEDFMYLVDMCHRNGIGIIIDWVPAHFPRDAHGLAFFDGTCLYEHEDPRKGAHKEWGTLIFNYGRNEVKNYLISNALFWLEKYHIDGLRVDAVASMLYLDYSRKSGEWVPNAYGGNENLEAIEFLKRFNEVVHQHHPGVLTIAEESTSWTGVSRPTYLGGLGFSMKWNMGWMHDTLSFFSTDPIHRKYHLNNLTFGMLYAFTENFVLPLSHDEIVYGKCSMADKMPGDSWCKFAGLRALYGYMYGFPGKKLLMMGSEFGQWNEWDFDKSLDWHLLQYEPHHKLLKFISDLNALYISEPAMHEVDFNWKGFEWIDFKDGENTVVSFIRRASDLEDFLIFVINLTPVPRHNYRIGVPKDGFYREMLNSDSAVYWGSNMGNEGGRFTDYFPCHGRDFSLNLTLPPLSVLVLKP
jgi:1,4-alpha-glucan branching enzyme